MNLKIELLFRSLIRIFFLDFFKNFLVFSLRWFLFILNINKSLLDEFFLEDCWIAFYLLNFVLRISAWLFVFFLFPIIWIEKSWKWKFWWVMQNMLICNSREGKISIIFLILWTLFNLWQIFLWFSFKICSFSPLLLFFFWNISIFIQNFFPHLNFDFLLLFPFFLGKRRFSHLIL